LSVNGEKQTCYITKVGYNALQANVFEFGFKFIVFFLDLIGKN